ncbi:MAG: hypothetical protein ABF289_02120 [Clostridiales bacterium]
MLYITDRYYEIKGKDKLKKNNLIPIRDRKFLSKKVLFKHQTHVRLQYNSNDYQTLIKTLFLIYLNQNSNFKFIKEHKITVNFFDKWWVVKYIPEYLDGNKISTLSDKILSKIDIENDYTMNYLESYKK